MFKLNWLYRKSNTKNPFQNLTKTLLHTAIFWAIFLYLLPQLIQWVEKHFSITTFCPVPLIAWILFILLSCLGLGSGITMSWLGSGTPLPLDGTNQLVIKGPYAYVRNPMAIAGIGQAVAVGLLLGSYGTILYAFSGALLWHFMVRPSEEKDLEKSFGKAYENYKKRVYCWWPNFKAYKP